MEDTYVLEVKKSAELNYEKIIATLPSFAADYFLDLKVQNKQPRTILQYAYDIKLFFDWLKDSPAFKDVNLNACHPADVLGKLTINDINEYLNQYTEQPFINEKGKKDKRYFSDAFRARKASSLRSFYFYYFKNGKIDKDLSALIAMPTVKFQRHEPLDQDAVLRLLEAVADIANNSNDHKSIIVAKRDLAILTILFGCGIRVGELVGINVEDVEFFEYRENKTDPYGSIFVTRKTGKEDRVYFGKSVKEALEDYMQNYRIEFFKNSNGFEQFMADPKSVPALFVSFGQRKRMSIRSVETLIKTYQKLAGFSDDFKITPHTCRRTFATTLLNETGDIYLTSEALGHSSVQTTKLYAKISDERKMKAASQSDKLFDRKKK